MQQVQVKSWGNSQGIILSKDILKSASIELGDYLDVDTNSGSITLRKPFRHKTLEERIAESGVPLTLSKELDYGEPVGREIW